MFPFQNPSGSLLPINFHTKLKKNFKSFPIHSTYQTQNTHISDNSIFPYNPLLPKHPKTLKQTNQWNSPKEDDSLSEVLYFLHHEKGKELEASWNLLGFFFSCSQAKGTHDKWQERILTGREITIYCRREMIKPCDKEKKYDFRKDAQGWVSERCFCFPDSQCSHKVFTEIGYR